VIRIPSKFWNLNLKSFSTYSRMFAGRLTSQLQNSVRNKKSIIANFLYSQLNNFVRFKVFTAVTIKNDVFLDVMPCGSCKNWRFGRKYPLHLQDRKSVEQETNLQQVTKQNGLLLGWYPTLKVEAISSAETWVHIRTTRHYIPENGNIHNYRCENLKSCNRIAIL
jgi:hypothetical protein